MTILLDSWRGRVRSGSHVRAVFNSTLLLVMAAKMAQPWKTAGFLAFQSKKQPLTRPRAGADPNAGTGVSLLNHNEILRSVTLTYLTNTFISSIYTYAQDTDLPYIKGIVNRAHTDAPMFVTFFKYSIGFWPESVLRLMGNLVQYRSKLWPTEHTTILSLQKMEMADSSD
jgi:hypothetical protein